MNQEKIFTERFLPLYGHMFRAATAILGKNSPEAADAVQEAMVKIWKSGAAMSRVENPEGYAIAAVRSSAIDILRKRHSSENIEDILNLSYGHPPDHDSGDFIERIIASLPVAQQEVIRLSAFENLSNEEIAAITGYTEVNVRQLLSRGRKKIKELYSKFL